jgi:CheY-like chemotaxis protein
MPSWTSFADGAAKLLAAITALLWPIIVAVVAWKLIPHVREVLKSRNFSIEVAGLKIGAQDFSEQVRTQIEDLQRKVSELRGAMPSPTTMTAPVGPLIVPSAPASVSHVPRVLWVDDNPQNNAFQIARLKSKSIDVVEARSTSEAMQLLGGNPSFSVVISDMGRREDGRFQPKAGLSLAEQMRNAGLTTPVFFYTSDAQAKWLTHDLPAGVTGVTSSPVELYEMLRATLGRDI